MVEMEGSVVGEVSKDEMGGGKAMLDNESQQ